MPTGIDYLSLIAARRAAELSGGRIDYAALGAESTEDTKGGTDHDDVEEDQR